MDWVTVYNTRTGKKLGRRPRSWLRLYPHLSETPATRRSPKKNTPATPAAEPSSEATDTAPEEENTNGPSS